MASYRIVVFALLAAITYYYTGNSGQSTVISVVFNVAGSVVYYAYERLWGAVKWGTSKTQRPGATQPSPADLGLMSVSRAVGGEIVHRDD